METAALGSTREQLLERRHQLEAVAAVAGPPDEVTRLLSEIDAALARLNAGTFGICETCRDPIEPERLTADPLTRFCIDHLTPREQRALEHDLELASRIQRGLLPKPDQRLDGWDVAYHYQPASTVSGDYCDVIPANSGDVYFLVGDVAGHGVAAAMLMSHLSALLRTLIPIGLTLSELMERANHAFCESTLTAHYATIVCARASPSGEIELSNAGHPPPLLLHNDVAMRIDATSVPIGLFCSGRFSSCRVQLEPGDALVLYTDGLPEAENPAGEEYSIDRIADRAMAATRTPLAIVDALVRDLTAFRASPVQTDDLTIFAINRSA
jgi:phosphoserine phosphatase RsbU/P